MLIVVNKESCMLLLQRRAEPRKRLHLYQPCANTPETFDLFIDSLASPTGEHRSPFYPPPSNPSSTVIPSGIAAAPNATMFLKAKPQSMHFNLIIPREIHNDRAIQLLSFRIRAKGIRTEFHWNGITSIQQQLKFKIKLLQHNLCS